MSLPVTASKHPARWWAPLRGWANRVPALPALVLSSTTGSAASVLSGQRVGDEMLLTTYGGAAGSAWTRSKRSP